MNKRKTLESGAATVFILGIIFIISILFLGVFSIMEFASSELKRNTIKNKHKEDLLNTAEKVIEFLMDDSTPFADSPLDSVWQEIDNIDGYSIILEDISSRLGINWIRQELFETLKENDFSVKQGVEYEDLHNIRENTGIHINIETAYKDIAEEDQLNTFFTGYSFFNINISNEFVLADLYEIRTGNNPESFRMKIHNARLKKGDEDPEHIKKDELKDFLNEDFGSLFPIINTEPVINIHFADDVIVKDLFLHYDIENAETKTENIMNTRETEELTEDMLKNIIDADEEEYKQLFIYQYLGIKTWFWKIEISKEDIENSPKLQWIIARVPQYEEDEDNDILKYRILEKKFTQ